MLDDSGRGPFMITVSGHRFYLEDPRPDDVFIEDIAHSLSRQCRFNGHTSVHYSVAQHSVLVSELVEEPELQLAALLHDAAEAYTGDIITPVKDALGTARDLERKIEVAIFERFGVPFDGRLPQPVKTADVEALKIEFSTLPPFCDFPDNRQTAVGECISQPWSAEEAYGHFMARFHQLTGGSRGFGRKSASIV